MKSIETKMEDISRYAKAGDKELERRMDEREKRQDEEAKRRERFLNEKWEQRESRWEEDAKRNYQTLYEKLDKVINGTTKLRREISETFKPKNDGVIITDSKNLQIQSGYNYHMGPSSRKKAETSSRGKVQPLRSFHFLPNAGISQPRNGIYNKMPFFKY